MKIQWVVLIILIVLVILALLIGVFAWMRKPQVSVIRPIAGEEVIVTGKAPSLQKVGGQVPPSRLSHASSSSPSPVTYRQILGQPA